MSGKVAKAVKPVAKKPLKDVKAVKDEADCGIAVGVITELFPIHNVGLLTDKIETVGVHGPIKMLGQLPEYSGTNEGGVYNVFVLKVRVTFEPLDVGSVPK